MPEASDLDLFGVADSFGEFERVKGQALLRTGPPPRQLRGSQWVRLQEAILLCRKYPSLQGRVVHVIEPGPADRHTDLDRAQDEAMLLVEWAHTDKLLLNYKGRNTPSQRRRTSGDESRLWGWLTSAASVSKVSLTHQTNARQSMAK
ncbi:hypothetical protein DPX16_2695 [Anabarilius grahami]|uniref:Uncharacterized protein n=1 Tax=Anabarilius grahami TaxID=495550 RepID=A0A3N0YPL1_ANAGA|nr:hypothetical protein DPX16_2695 [Anabarilius grahami]